MNNTSPNSTKNLNNGVDVKKLYRVPRRNEHRPRNHEWGWDDNKNRLITKHVQVETSEFHDETFNYLK